MKKPPITYPLSKTLAEWRAQLDDMAFYVTREKGTERPFTGRYWNFEGTGVYRCICCATVVFSSQTKFDAGCGWPSFSLPHDATAIDEHQDSSHGMQRTEVLCSGCGAHLGHVFPDGPPPSGLRYCINSASLVFQAD